MEAANLPPDVVADMKKAIEIAMTGKRDPEFEKRVHDEGRRIREEVFKRHACWISPCRQFANSATANDLRPRFQYQPLIPRAYEIASQARIGVYDCLYVALSESEKCQLLTADDRLIKVLQPSFPQIVHLASLP